VKVHPALLWVLVVLSGLVGAVAGILVEGFLDKLLLQKYDIVGDNGILEEALATVIGATLGAAFVGLLAFVAYRLFLSTRR
jgi:hypothetical protein